MSPRLSSVGPRLAGYPGAEKAANYIVGELRKLGIKSASRGGLDPQAPYKEAFWVTVPWVSEQPTIEVLGKDGTTLATYPVYPLWPNLVRTSQLPAERPGVPVGERRRRHSCPRSTGKNMDGTAVLMDFNCGLSWLNAPRLGATAVIFVEPDTTTRGEAEAKFLRIPINIPRFWIGRSDAYELQARLESQPDVQVRIKCRMTWQRRRAWNIVAEIPGHRQGTGQRERLPQRLLRLHVRRAPAFTRRGERRRRGQPAGNGPASCKSIRLSAPSACSSPAPTSSDSRGSATTWRRTWRT